MISKSRRKRAFKGPWWGLVTTLPRRELGPGMATVANNVILSEGRIRPRNPIAYYTDALLNSTPIGLFEYDVDRSLGTFSTGTNVRLLVKLIGTGSSGTIGYVRRQVEAAPRYVELISGLSQRSPTFVVANGSVYCLDGTNGGQTWETRNRSVKVTPTGQALLIGMSKPVPIEHTNPPVFTWQEFGPLPGDLTVGTTYDYAVTFYDSVNNVESNPDYIGEVTIPAEPPDVIRGVQLVFGPANEIRALEGATHFRIYRRSRTNTTSYPPGYRYVGSSQISTQAQASSFFDWIDDDGLEAAGLSSDITGPFAPSRNGIPPASTVGVYYNDRMWYNDVNNGNRLRFSAIGRPDHVDPFDYYDLQDDTGSPITGMAVLSGQLVVAKERSVWIIAGNPVTPTNLSAATGAEVEIGDPVIYQTKCPVGCSAVAGGNGMVVAGHPPRAYWCHATGFYSFDGVDVEQVSRWIRPTWEQWGAQNIVGGESFQTVSYAIDAKLEIIYVCNAGYGSVSSGPNVLAYHYGNRTPDGAGTWTRMEFSLSQTVRTICSSVGRRSTGSQAITAILNHAGIIVGITSSGILIDAPRDFEPAMPAWEWQSGDLILDEAGAVHLYQVDWLLAPSSLPASVDVGFRPTTASVFADVRVDLAAGKFSKSQPMRRTLPAVVLHAKSVAGSKWDVNAGLVGWVLDVEETGAR